MIVIKTIELLTSPPSRVLEGQSNMSHKLTMGQWRKLFLFKLKYHYDLLKGNIIK
jgi:hypothetical protein